MMRGNRAQSIKVDFSHLKISENSSFLPQSLTHRLHACHSYAWIKIWVEAWEWSCLKCTLLLCHTLHQQAHKSFFLCICKIVYSITSVFQQWQHPPVGGASSNEGRVEVCVNGMWGTVTNYQWDSREATVVCKQLGYQNPGEWNSSKIYHKNFQLIQYALPNYNRTMMHSAWVIGVSYYTLRKG